MYNDIDFLKSLYKNAEMGIIGINELLEYDMSTRFRNTILRQRKGYVLILDDTKELLRKYNEKACKVSCLLLLMTKLTTIMMIRDNNESKMSKLLIEGSNKGIIKVNKMLNNTPKLNKKAKELALDHLYLIQNNINELKVFL